MLFKTGFVLLIAWLVGVSGVVEVGRLVHVLLMVGLMFLMFGVLKARDAAMAAARPERPPR